MDKFKLLQIFLILGGIIELLLGILFILIDPFLEQLGFKNFPIFFQMSGLFVFFYGILLIYASKNIKQFALIVLINIFIRFAMIIFTIIDIFFYPEIIVIAIFAITYDLLWSITVLILLKINGIIIEKK